MPRNTPARRGGLHVGWTSAIVGWSLAVVGMVWWITDYEFATTDSAGSAAVTEWPTASALKLSNVRPTLVFFMHPKCPCTRASLAELRKLMEASTVTDPQLPELTIAISQPKDVDAGWSNTDTVRHAMLLPRATMFTDVDGLEAERFGAVASGTVMLFDTTGKRMFAGGITASRGHEGDSAGGVLLRRLLKHEDVRSVATLPTFGCKLCSPGESAGDGVCERCQAQSR